MNKSLSASAVALIAIATSIVTSVVTVVVVVRLNLFSGGGDIAVPDVLGLSEQDARANLESRGLVMNITGRKEAAGARPGTVLAQQPFAGKKVDGGAVVSITLVRETPTVPKVTGLTVAEATLLIEQAGFKLRVGEQVDSDDVASGKIAKQVPAAGSEYDKGRTVTIMPSGGPSSVEVPKLTGMGLNRAKAAIKAAGFKVGQTRWSYNEDYGVYAVLQQTPAAGEKAKPGSAIDLVVNEE